MRIASLGVLGAVASFGLAPTASAQFGNQWTSFTKDNSLLGVNPRFVSDGTTSLPGDTPGPSLLGVETDLAWGDLDKDGWTDLVVVRKQPYTSAGKRTNLLLMNEGGVLQDRTVLYATAADVVGDQGFLTPTNDRDVVLADVDGDTWLDVITAPTISDTDSKSIGHPRIYMNRGNDDAGQWLGLVYEEARIPQLYSYSSGLPTNPRFCSVAAGDLTGNGLPDLYFGDYDSSGAGGVVQPLGADMNDRLLINDGTGFFSDQSQLRMSDSMLLSTFGMSTVIADMNGDGHNDVIKNTALLPPQDVRVIYNDPNAVGTFNIQDQFHQQEPYHVSIGDLNNDGLLDGVFSDDFQDRMRYNLGNDVLGRVIWGPPLTFDFLVGGDDGFASNNMIVDIDDDGWADVLIADVDVDVPGFGSRRMHIYHNPGGAVGSEIHLLEERELAGDGGWIGAGGLFDADLRHTHDFAVFDLDNDLDKDLIISTANGTNIYTQDGGVFCQTSIGYGGPGNSVLTACGDELTGAGKASLLLSGAPPNALSIWAAGTVFDPTPLLGGHLVPVPAITLVAYTTGPDGTFELPAALSGGGGPSTFYVQAGTFDPDLPQQWDISNTLEIQVSP